MSRSRKSLFTLIIAALVLILTAGCSALGLDDPKKSDAQASIVVDTTDATATGSIDTSKITDQNPTIGVGDLDTITLWTEIVWDGSVCMTASLATKRIDGDAAEAQKLSIGELTDDVCAAHHDEESAGFLSVLVPGEYVVVVKGKETPVTITVEDMGSGPTEIDTETPESTEESSSTEAPTTTAAG